ncbi:hypothetical protein M885DRAFT_528320 [Pelagophyceae sp. CCMP2097]|nr:hypothetical protein M885DRAFT_528320 [Pelagophyceae sp. CCMP2097]
MASAPPSGTAPPLPVNKFFNSDRGIKYGWGTLRLGLLCVAAFEVAPRLLTSGFDASLGLAAYAKSGRWLAHAYMGSIGAAVNVDVNSFALNIALLLAAALLVARDLSIDYCVVAYLLKTFCGDFLAGKLDTTEWKLVLLFTVGVAVAAVHFAPHGAFFDAYGRVTVALFLIQLVCELGDRHVEHHPVIGKFFRHRYSFECFTAVLLFSGALDAPVELRAVQHDLVTCLAYRCANVAIIVWRSSDDFMLFAGKWAFRLLGVLTGTPLELVADVKDAMLVLKASSQKGDALERLVATPAWHPVVSLESVDSPHYACMIRDFHVLLKKLPPVAVLVDYANRHLDVLLQSGQVIDSQAVTRWSVAAFAAYIFHDDGADVDALVDAVTDASWEWRKEIALRGRADADVKRRAIAALLAALEKSKLWPVFGAQWREGRYYSLIMQPFLLSPAINFSDIAMAMHQHAVLSCEAAMRIQHPFPVLERFVDADVVRKDGSVAVKGGTQVIMFTGDFSSTVLWPVFGAGPRACAGTQLALPLVQLLHARLVRGDAAVRKRFRPDVGHKFSGRDNDNNWTFTEMRYFAAVVAGVLFKGAAKRLWPAPKND